MKKDLPKKAYFMEEPWNPEALTGISRGKNEQLVARYLGYTNIGDYRAYQCSHPVMGVFLEWLKVKEGQFNSKTLSKLLAEEDRDIAFGGDLAQLKERHPHSTDQISEDLCKSNRNKILTGLIYHLVHTELVWDKDSQLATKKILQQRCPDKILADIEAASIAPKWGPFESEAWGEPYNRAWNLISSLQNSYVRWSEGRLTGVLKRRKIPVSDTPKFMILAQPDAEESRKTSVQIHVRDPTAVLAPKIFKIYWADTRSIREELEDAYETLPALQQNAYEPRNISGEEWRDKIRMQYNFPTLQRNFTSITLHWRNNSDDQTHDLLNGDWSAAQDIFHQTPADQFDSIRFKTRALGENEVSREFTDIPSTLRSYARKTASGQLETFLPDLSSGARPRPEVEMHGQEMPKTDPLPEEKQSPEDETLIEHQENPTTSKSSRKRARHLEEEDKRKQYTEAVISKIADRVGRSRDPTAGPGYPDPVKAYKTTSLEDILNEHQGYDVRQPHMKRNWQVKMLQKYSAGSVVRSKIGVDTAVLEIGAGSQVSLGSWDMSGGTLLIEIIDLSSDQALDEEMEDVNGRSQDMTFSERQTAL